MMKSEFINKMTRCAAICCCFMLFFSSCNSKKEKLIAESIRQFADNNWSYEDHFVYFDVDINDVSKPCKVVVEIENLPDIEINTLQLIVTITGPDGTENERKANVAFYESRANNSTTTVTEVYPYKSFYTPGTYKFKIYRRYEKYYLYGIKSLKLKVIQIPELEGK